MKANEKERFAVECADRLGKVLDACKMRYNQARRRAEEILGKNVSLNQVLEGHVKVDEEEDGNGYCVDCSSGIFCTCSSCKRETYIWDAEYNKGGDPFCQDCYSNIYTYCEECGGEVEKKQAFLDPGNDTFYRSFCCSSCYKKKLFVECRVCHAVIARDDVIWGDDGPVCQGCAP